MSACVQRNILRSILRAAVLYFKKRFCFGKRATARRDGQGLFSLEAKQKSLAAWLQASLLPNGTSTCTLTLPALHSNA